jgi:hypothetical protein
MTICPPFSAYIKKNVWRHMSAPLYMLMAWRLIKRETLLQLDTVVILFLICGLLFNEGFGGGGASE